MTRLRHLVLAPAFPLLLAACSAGPDAPDGPIPDVAASAPAAREGKAGASGRGLVGSRLRVTDWGCAIGPSDTSAGGERLRFIVEEPVVHQTVFDIVAIGRPHTFEDLETYLRRTGTVRTSGRDSPYSFRPGWVGTDRVDIRLPGYVDSSLAGRADDAWHGGRGPQLASSHLVLNRGSTGSWSGPPGGAAPGTYAVICYQWADERWITGVAGPIEVTGIVETYRLDERAGTYFVDVGTGEVNPLPPSITDLATGWDRVGYQGTPDGSSLLFVGEDDRHRTQVFLAAIDGSEVRQLTDEPEGAEAANLSPDGRMIVYVALSGTSRQDLPADLVVMDVATGEKTIILHADGYPADGNELRFGRNEIQYPRFSPDGRTILFTRGIGGYELWTIPVAGGQITRILAGGYDGFFSPDGTTIAFHRDREVTFPHGGTSAPQVWLADADGTDARPFAGVNSGGPRWSPGGTWFAFSKGGRPSDPLFLEGEPVGLTGPGTEDGEGGLVVLELATGRITKIFDPTPIGWLDDHTLIVEIIAPRLLR